MSAIPNHSFLTAIAACAAVVGIVYGLFPWHDPFEGPADIVPSMESGSFYGTRAMGSSYDGPVVWVETEGGWRPMRSDELASLPYRADGYPCIPIEQVSAQDYFRQFGAWPNKPSTEQIWHLCDWQRQRGFVNGPCEELDSN